MGLSLKIGSIGYILYLIYMLSRKEGYKTKFMSLYIFTAFSEIYLQLGYLFTIGGYEINYSYVAVVLLFIVAIYCQIMYKAKMPTWGAPFLIIVFIGVLIRMISPNKLYGVDHYTSIDNLFTISNPSLPLLKINSYSFISLVKTFLFVYSSVFFASIYQQDKFEKIILKYGTFFKGYTLFSIIELLVNNLINPKLIRNITLFIFGRQKTAAIIPYYRAGLYSTLLTCWEPSLTAYAMFFCLIGISWIHTKQKKKNDKLFMGMALFSMVSSLALTGILMAATYIIILLTKKSNRKKLAKIIPVIFISILLATSVILLSDSLSEYFVPRFERSFVFIKKILLENPSFNSVTSSYGDVSEIVRLYSMWLCLQLLAKTPLFGTGIGTGTALSGFITLISNVGILGILAYNHIVKKFFYRIGKKDFISAFIILCIPFTLQGGITDIVMSCYYFIWLILIYDILKYYKQQNLNEIETTNN